jgi:SAM-dependent methyltransferase
LPGELRSFPFKNFKQARNPTLGCAFASPLAVAKSEGAVRGPRTDVNRQYRIHNKLVFGRLSPEHHHLRDWLLGTVEDKLLYTNPARFRGLYHWMDTNQFSQNVKTDDLDVGPAGRITLLVHPKMRSVLASLIEMLFSGLSELSFSPAIVGDSLSDWQVSRVIVLGANFFGGEQLNSLPRDSIIFNVENTSSSFFTEEYIKLLRKFTVWDFDLRNTLELSQLIVRPVRYVRLFYVNSLKRITGGADKDIDVLFFGSFNPRRSAVLDSLRARGISVSAVFGVFGADLDNLIARSKVVINIHFYANGRVEMIRLFDLLANSQTIVSELNPGEELDDDLRGAFATAPYEGLVDATEALVHDPERCATLAKTGFCAFSSRSSNILGEALAWSDQRRIPAHAVIGSGKLYDPNLLNIDNDARWHPDVVADISDRALFEREFTSHRFGMLRLQRGWFDSIVTSHVLEHIPDLVTAMSNCLELLCNGGVLKVTVPYDLAYGAWQDPTHVHAFNERSWLYYCEWYWYLGWTRSRFDLVEQKFRYSPLGETLAGRGCSAEEILRSPRAVDEMYVVLRKRPLTEAEIDTGRKMRGDSRGPEAPVFERS